MTNERQVTVDLEGESFTGTYTVSRGVVTVTAYFGTKSTQLGGGTPESVARMLLHELARREKHLREREKK